MFGILKLFSKSNKVYLLPRDKWKKTIKINAQNDPFLQTEKSERLKNFLNHIPNTKKTLQSDDAWTQS